MRIGAVAVEDRICRQVSHPDGVAVWQITHDISDARVYGGIHYRSDQNAGARLGRAVGAAVYKHNLRRTDDDDDKDKDGEK